VRGATPSRRATGPRPPVSIRAPRAGGDATPGPRHKNTRSFNPRPPCGGRLTVLDKVPGRLKFQSAPPVRGATTYFVIEGNKQVSFNPRPPCGGRRALEGDPRVRDQFQSAPPVRGATVDELTARATIDVSIRAPRAGGDRP